MKPKDKDKFIVIIRVKPANDDDRQLYTQKQMQNTLKFNSNMITIYKRSFEDKVYHFNHIFNEQSQKDVYKEAEHLAHELFEGYNATFLAYGQTGTGKTHTVFGSKQAVIQSSPKHPEAGMFYRSAATIFDLIHARMHERQFSVRVSFIEFYLDNVYDLLAEEPEEDNRGKKGPRKVELKEEPKNGVVIKDLTEVAVKSLEDLVNAVKKPIRMRKTEATTLNQKSSRSHAVIQITVMQRWNVGDAEGTLQTKYRKGTLKIVDLAGSQRVSKTEAEGTRLEQTKRINKEITTLGKCISALVVLERNQSTKVQLSQKFSLNKGHVPFRDCKLTRFLADSLEGKCKIVLCVCISNFAVHSEQTFSSLRFASEASTLKVDAQKYEEFIRIQPKQQKVVQNLNSSLANSQQHFQTPIKYRLRTQGSKQKQQSLFKNTTMVNGSHIQKSQNNAVSEFQQLKTDLRLIHDQMNGNFEEMDLNTLPRPVLQRALKTYSGIIRELQEQLQVANNKIVELERKSTSRY